MFMISTEFSVQAIEEPQTSRISRYVLTMPDKKSPNDQQESLGTVDDVCHMIRASEADANANGRNERLALLQIMKELVYERSLSKFISERTLSTNEIAR